MRPTAVVFDFDGTLLDTGPGIMRCAAATGEAMGFVLPQGANFRRFIGPPLVHSFMRVYGVDEKAACEAADYYRDLYAKTDAIREAEVYSGIPELLADLREAGIGTGIASAKRTPLIHEMLDYYKLAPLIDTVQGAPPTNDPANKPELLAKALRDLGAKPEEGLMVGDSDYDGDAANACGAPFAAVLWGYGFDDAAAAQRYEDAYIVRRVDDLRRLIFEQL